MYCTDGPKFINCEGLSEGRRLYEKDVRVVCDIQSQPAVNAVSVHWTDSPAAATSRPTSQQVVNLTAGQREGHHVLLLQPSNTSVRMLRYTL